MKRIIHPKQHPPSSEDVNKFLSHKFNVTKFLFPEQLAFVEDPSPFKSAVCSRRAGKTVACAAHLIDVAIKTKDINCLYITLARTQAKKLIWKELKKIDMDCKLNATFDESELSMTLPNGSMIYCSGAKDSSEIEKFRGMALKLVYIDECQSFRSYIQELIDDVIAPALMDYAGDLCLIGTPGPVPTGYFYDCAVVNPIWKKFHWTFWDNPHIAIKSKKTHQEVFDRELTRRGVTQDDPSIQREWFGKWVLDSNSLLIQYDKNKNHFEELPTGHTYNYIMGVDVGFNDADAIGVLAWSETDPITYLVEELIVPKQGITELAQQIEFFQKKYNVSKIVMDMGGLGKKIGEEIIRRFLIPVEAAEKSRKMENIQLMNDALRSGRLKAKEKSQFAQDSFLVEIDREKSTPERIKVSDRFHSDIIDAVLYAFKLSPAYAYTPPVPGPKYGTREWAEAQENTMFEATLEGLQNEERAAKGLFGHEE